jgi:hypothetical protein
LIWAENKEETAMKLLSAAGALLLFTANIAVAEKPVKPPEPLIIPDIIYDRQPFTFAVIPDVKNASRAEGEVVNVQTVEGVVVQRSSADRYGRIFLAAGLPAGAYLISRGVDSKPLGKLAIHPRSPDLETQPSQPKPVLKPPPPAKIDDPFILYGHGFSPNSSDMSVTLPGCGPAQPPVVLAATEAQLKLAPLQLQPGVCQLRVTNHSNGQSTDALPLLFYDIQGRMERRKLVSSGDQTDLVVTVKPEGLPLKVRATVISGPVDFGGGRKEAESITRDGKAVFPVHTEHGAGPFELSWELVPDAPKPPKTEPR